MKYIICGNDNTFLQFKKKQYMVTNDINQAVKFTDKSKTVKALRTINKSTKNYNFKIVEVEEESFFEQLDDIEIEETLSDIEGNIEVNEDEVIIPEEVVIETKVEEIKKSKSISKSKEVEIDIDTTLKDCKFDSLEFLNKYESYIKSARKNQILLKNAITKIESELLDIRHAIEKYDLNVCQAYKIYDLQRKKLRERRIYKDELFIIDKIIDSQLNNSNNLKIVEEVNKHIKYRNYTPRENEDLFNGEFFGSEPKIANTWSK